MLKSPAELTRNERTQALIVIQEHNRENLRLLKTLREDGHGVLGVPFLGTSATMISRCEIQDLCKGLKEIDQIRFLLLRYDCRQITKDILNQQKGKHAKL